MAITREAKEQAVDQLTAELGRIKLAVMTDYRGLSVQEIEELRGILRQQGISYRVTKNTLLRLAAAGSNTFKSLDPEVFSGPMALALGFDDEVAPAKAIYQYAKDHKSLEIVGALSSDGRLLKPAEVKQLAQLPSREQLLAQLVGTIAAPMSGLVGVMNSQIRSIINVLSALQEAKV